MSEAPVLSVRHITKSFGVARRTDGNGAARDPRRQPGWRRDRFFALRDVSFEVAAGRALGLVGANGSGKTTLLKILAGAMTADAGAFLARGRVGALLELGAGFHPELSGIENVHLNAALLGLSRRETEGLMAEIIAFAGLERFMDMPVKHYSSGMIVRLGFAVAAQLRPDVLLLDETFAVGDATFQARALARIRQMRAAGVTMILVSHSPEYIMELADEVVWLDRGRVVMMGPPRTVMAAYRREADVGRPVGPRRRDEAGRGDAGGAAGAPMRLLAARVGRAEGAGGGGGFVGRSPDRLELAIDVEGAVGAEWPVDWLIAVYFTRDDRRVAAEARLEPAGLGGLNAPPAPAATLRLTFEPVALAQGVYDVTVALVRRAEGGAETVAQSLSLPEAVEILTPPPYEFRLVAEVPAQWE